MTSVKVNNTWVRTADSPPRLRGQVSIRLPLEVIEATERLAMDMTARPPFVRVTLSDVVRIALEAMLKAGAEPVERPRPCRWTYEGERALCTACGLKDPTEDCRHAK